VAALGHAVLVWSPLSGHFTGNHDGLLTKQDDLTVPKEAVPAACPIGRSTPDTHGHSWTARHTGSPAYGQADPLRKQAF
jgi:hypothetical protein